MKIPIAVLTLCLAASGCKTWTCHPEQGDFCVDGTLTQGLRPDLETEDVRGRLAHLKEVSVAYWGHDRTALDGWRFVIKPGPFPCGSSVTGMCSGDTDPWDHTITVAMDPGTWKDCPEWAAIPHEIGHAVQYDSILNLNGDHGHSDGRFRTFQLITHEVIQDNIAACKGAAYYIEHNEFWNIHPGTS